MTAKEKEKAIAGYNQTLQLKNVILLAPAGSELLGLSNADSDRDEMGIYVEDFKDVAGFAPTDFLEYRSARERVGKHDAKSEPGDIDLSLYGLRKYLKLAIGGNPNLVSMLFVQEGLCKVITPLGRELKALRNKILSVNVAQAFIGYLTSQRNRLIGSEGQKRVNRPELEKAYGFDTHYAMHMVRLGMQGAELIKTGVLQLPMEPWQKKILKQIKTGQMSLDGCLRYADEYLEEMDIFTANSPLPKRPDYKAVEDWLLSVYKKNWYEDKAAPQQQGIEADKTREDARTSKADSQEIRDSLRELLDEDIPF